MLEQMNLDGVETLPVQLGIWEEESADRQLMMTYYQLKNTLDSFSYSTPEAFQAAINASTNPENELAVWSTLIK